MPYYRGQRPEDEGTAVVEFLLTGFRFQLTPQEDTETYAGTGGVKKGKA